MREETLENIFLYQKQHMELLAELSRLLQQDQVRDDLVEAASAADVLAIFKSGG